MATTKAKAAAYLRVSGLGQVEGDGFPRQRSTIAAWAKAKRVEIVEEFRDEGVSGATDLDHRDGLAALLDRIDSNGIRMVVVEDMSRLARDLMVGEIILTQFRERGVRVFSASGDEELTNDDDPTKTLIRQVLLAVSAFDRKVIVRKLRAARDRKSRKSGGRIEGAKAFGTLPGEAETLERMRGLRVKTRGEARRSFASIAKTLNDEGHQTRHGRPWKPESIRKILGRVTLQTVVVQRQKDGGNKVVAVTERLVRRERRG
jgi:DNA invertase Pin-like site-specific DNA recombinase